MASITELYEFNVNGTYATFCQSILPITFNGKVYSPSLISRDRINLTDNVLKNTLVVNLPRTNDFARSLLVNMPEVPVLFTLYRNSLPYWQGRVLSAEGAGLLIRLSCVTLQSLVTRPGITARVQITCRHRLYSQNCGAIKAIFATNTTVNSITTNGLTITTLATGKPDHYFLNGEVEYGNNRRRIVKHVGNDIKINYPFPTLPSGAIILYPGCDHTESTCLNKFNNVINFGGASRMPLKDPHSSSGLL